MTFDLQTVAALLVVLAAVGYLARIWWRKHPKSGCGNAAGECACPSTATDFKSNITSKSSNHSP